MRGAVLLLLLSGCSSETPIAMLDLSAPNPCTFVYSGDESGTQRCEISLFCPFDGSYLLHLIEPTGRSELDFSVAGLFVVGKHYGTDDLSYSAQFTTGFDPSQPHYGGGNGVSGSTATLTLTDAVPMTAPCPYDGIAHGTAHVDLIESAPPDGGVTAPGRLTLDASF